MPVSPAFSPRYKNPNSRGTDVKKQTIPKCDWQSVIELGGRYAEGSEMVHQLTVGALWVHPSCVLETGIIQDLNGPNTTSFLLGIRKHF